MNCRQLYLPIACVLVFIVAGISGELQQTPSTAPAIPYYILKNANIANISSNYILTKLVVKISSGDIKDQSYVVCVGYHYGNASGDFAGLKQYQYNKLDGTVTENDLSPFVLTFLDMNMIDKGDRACSIAIMEDLGPYMRLGPPFSSYQVDHKPIVTALSKPDYAAVNTALFYCNKVSIFLTLKSDIWGFGITVYEIVAGKEPHADEDQLEIALKIRNGGATPKIPEDCDPVLRECMEMCWKFNPNDRPTMEEVCAFIRAKTTGASGNIMFFLLTRTLYRV